jgi:dGTPase
LLLGVLKYPVAYSEYGDKAYGRKPPKCFYDDDLPIVEKALEIFPSSDVRTFRSLGSDGKPAYRNFDCAIMELADDIAYGVHDMEDGIGRRLLLKDEVADKIRDTFLDNGIKEITAGLTKLTIDDLIKNLFSKDPAQRKFAISTMVGYFIEQIQASRRGVFESPYLDWTVFMPEGPRRAIEFLSKKITFENIIRRPEIQTLEYKGEKIIGDIFAALSRDPLSLIGEETLEMQSKGLSDILKGLTKSASDWQKLPEPDRSIIARGICDFIASMTDTSAERYHRRLFEPGYGSSTDEL